MSEGGAVIFNPQSTIRAHHNPTSTPSGTLKSYHGVTRLPECGTPGLEESPREGNKQHLPTDRSRYNACTALAWFAATQGRGGGGSITVKPGTAPKTPRFMAPLLRSSYPLSTQDPLATRAEACCGVRARCRGLHAVIIEMTCSMHATLTAVSIFQVRPRSEKPMIHCVPCY